MQAKYLRSLFFLIFLNVIVKPVWLLGIDRGVQHATGIDSYGVYYFILSISFYLQMVLDPGLHTHNNKTLAQDPNRLSENLTEFLPLKLILSLIYLLATLGIGFVMVWLNKSSPSTSATGLAFNFGCLGLLWWIAFNQVLASVILYMRSCLSGIYLFNTDSVFSVLDRTLMIIMVGLMLWGNFMPKPFKIQWFVYAQTVSYSITAIAVTIVVLAKAKEKLKKPKIRLASYTDILSKSYPFAVLAFLMILYTQIDRTMVYNMLPDGEHQLGLYAMAYRMLDAFSQVAFLFATILLPVYTGLIYRKEPIAQTVRVFSRLLLVPGLLLVLISFFYRNEMMALLYKNQSSPYLGQVFGWLMVTFIAYAMVYIYGTLLTANGNLKFLNWTAAGGLVVNVLINLALIPFMGVLGAVVATLATQFAVSLLQFWKSHKLFDLEVSWTETLKVFVYVAVAVLSFAWLHGMGIKWYYGVAVLTAFNLTFAFVTGLLNLKFFIEIIKYKS